MVSCVPFVARKKLEKLFFVIFSRSNLCFEIPTGVRASYRRCRIFVVDLPLFSVLTGCTSRRLGSVMIVLETV